MGNELIRSLEGGIFTLALNRPKRHNALSPDLLAEIGLALDEAASRDDVRVVVLRGADAQPFSSGYDMGEIGTDPFTPARARELQQPIRAVARAMISLPKPVIGAAQRFVFGAALDVFAHCDLRVATTDTRFVLPPAKLGFSYPAEGLARMVDLVGASRVTEMALIAEPADASAMLQWGFLHRIWPVDRFEAELQQFAALLTTRAPLSLGALKRSITALAGGADESVISASYEDFARCLSSHDAREGKAAATEKRTPRFTGR